MARTAVLGLPRIGPDRELKFALEDHWAGRAPADELLETARALRAASWQRARDAGIDVIPRATSASTTTSSTPRGRSARSRSASAGRTPTASTPTSRWRAGPRARTRWR